MSDKNSDKWKSTTGEKNRRVKLRRRTLQKRIVGMNKKKRGNPITACFAEEEE